MLERRYLMSEILCETKQNVYRKIDELWEEEVEFLQNIGRFPSTLGNEAEIQRYLAEYFANKLSLQVDEFEPNVDQLSNHPAYSLPEWSYEGRQVVVGTAAAKGPQIGKSLILQGHIDVVSPEPTSEWTRDPWGAVIEGDKMYGRGIQDMKSGVAAMIFAYQAIKESGIELGADLIIQSVIEEECTGNGALAALERGHVAEAALIPEPFGQQAVVSQVGVFWVRVTVKGVGAHTERASEAINAIEKSYNIIEAFKSYEKYINSQPRHKDFEQHVHPLNVNIGKISSGDWPSSVPSECVIEARVGFYPGRNPNDVKTELKDWLLRAADEDEWLRKMKPEISFYGFHAEGLSLDPSTHLFQSLKTSHEEVTNQPLSYTALTCTTDIRFFNLHYDIPATCYGPTGGNMHGIDEWVDLKSVKEVTKVYAAFILDWCKIQAKKTL